MKYAKRGRPIKSGMRLNPIRAIVLGAALALAAPAALASEPAGVPFSCHMYEWYDLMNWWYGYAGICYYPGGGSQLFDHNGGYW